MWIRDPGSGMEKIRIRDGKNSNSGWKKFGSGCATLHADMRQYKDDRPGCGRAALAAFPSGWAASAPGCSSPLRALRVVTHTHISLTSAQFAGKKCLLMILTFIQTTGNYLTTACTAQIICAGHFLQKNTLTISIYSGSGSKSDPKNK
jgi:hypothetical protein